MNIETLRNYCLSKADVEEGFPFGPETLVMKVEGKIFLLTGLDGTDFRFNVKCDPVAIVFLLLLIAALKIQGLLYYYQLHI